MSQELLCNTPMVETSYGTKKPPFRMDGYYIGFEPTGVLAIDHILCAIACAGKAYHYTEDWSESCDPYEPFLRGECASSWIQNAADEAAEAIRAARISKGEGE